MPATNHEYAARFTPLDKYLELSGEVYQLIRANHNGVLYFVHNGKVLQYDETRDGTPLDLASIKRLYPEYLL